MFSIIKLLRPQQWAKNLFIFLPAFFAGQLFNQDILFSCIIAFIAFSFAASSIYCFNDIIDAKTDKLHPEKCKRPVASGKISVKIAYFTMVICFLLGFLTLFLFAETEKYMLMGLLLFYYVMNILYCIKLKQFVIIDVMIIAVGFVVRIFFGGISTDIFVSEWIVIMTFLLALFLAFAKRRDDFILYQETGKSQRIHTNRYNLEFIAQILGIISAITIVSYIMYSLSPEVTQRLENRNVYLTTFFVLSGIIRYLQLTIVDEKSSSPTNILFSDRFIQFCVTGWLISFLWIIYL